eukprot:UN12716
MTQSHDEIKLRAVINDQTRREKGEEIKTKSLDNPEWVCETFDKMFTDWYTEDLKPLEDFRDTIHKKFFLKG